MEIARALATSPQVLMLDDPAAGVGQQERDWLVRDLPGNKIPALEPHR